MRRIKLSELLKLFLVTSIMVTSSKYGRAYRPAGEISDEEVNKIVEKN